jgi:cytoskeletal protein RodZ
LNGGTNGGDIKALVVIGVCVLFGIMLIISIFGDMFPEKTTTIPSSNITNSMSTQSSIDPLKTNSTNSNSTTTNNQSDPPSTKLLKININTKLLFYMVNRL